MNKIIALYIATLLLLLGVAIKSQAKDYNIELDLNRGHNSNVYLSADEDIVVSDSTEDYAQQDTQTQLSLMGSYEFFDGKSSDAKVLFDYFKESFSENDIDSTMTSVSIPYTYYANQYRLRATPAVMRCVLSGENVLNYRSGKIDLTRKINNIKVGLQYGYIKKSPQVASYDVYEGNSQNIKAHAAFKNNASIINVYANIFNNDYQDEYSSNDGFYLKASYKKRYKGTSFRLSGKYKNSSYISDPLLEGIARTDNQISISYMQDLDVSNMTQLYFNSEYINNDSNVELESDNYSYDQWINTLGMRFSF